MVFDSKKAARRPAPVSDKILQGIVEQGFFGSPGSLADARSACAELLFARAMIEAQTARISRTYLSGLSALPTRLRLAYSVIAGSLI